MWKITRLALIGVAFALAFCIGPRAHAQTGCPLPYLLQNGTIADASQVMANLNTLGACIGSGLTCRSRASLSGLLPLIQLIHVPGYQEIGLSGTP
jgi:hypothetical protein